MLYNFLKSTIMEKKIYLQPMTKVLTLGVYKDVCEPEVIYGPPISDFSDEAVPEAPLF